jgi:hypothetical protein
VGWVSRRKDRAREEASEPLFGEDWWVAERFSEWVWEDPARAAALARIIREHASRGQISAAEPEYGDLEPGQ